MRLPFLISYEPCCCSGFLSDCVGRRLSGRKRLNSRGLFLHVSSVSKEQEFKTSIVSHGRGRIAGEGLLHDVDLWRSDEFTMSFCGLPDLVFQSLA